MNRLVLIGNGFDLAHGLKTSYADFINWYKEYRIRQLYQVHNNISEDALCTIKLNERQALSTYVSNYFVWDDHKMSLVEYFDYIFENTHEFETKKSLFFERTLKNIETKGWVDIENEYYALLKQYAFDSVMKEDGKISFLQSLNRQLDYLKDLLVEYLEYIKIGRAHV